LTKSSTSDRKKDHIDLAFASAIAKQDGRFYYEPVLGTHPTPNDKLEGFNIAGKQTKSPLWISSMTGGTELAGQINHNLARACNEFGLGMGLGSCRILLESDKYFKDFDLRDTIGDSLPFYANLGIAQVEQMLKEGKVSQINELVGKLRADGLIVHINPLQEWLQPEGDRFQERPIDTLNKLIKMANYPIIVKEVGQGMGPESLLALMSLPLAAIEFGASGGTNFAKLELMRNRNGDAEYHEELAHIGHSAEEMIEFVNDINSANNAFLCDKFIVSGGVKNYLDGYYLLNKIKSEAAFAMASGFLKHAMGTYDELKEFTKLQLEGLKMANNLLRVRE
jgi:isopentenyl-diphosphate delta-isomerase